MLFSINTILFITINIPYIFIPNTGNKALTLGHYLADPIAKAALMDLGRYGHYPLGKKLFGCPQCRYVTDRKNNLKRHIATMHQECDKLLECCGVAFKNKASLRDHVLIFHSNGYMCRYCGRNFCRKALLKRHLTVHSGQKDYVCPLCDYATSHKSNLERHKKVHERQGSDQEDSGDTQTEVYGYSQAHARAHAHAHGSLPMTSSSYGANAPAGLRSYHRSSQSTSGCADRRSLPLDGATSSSHSVATVTSSSRDESKVKVDDESKVKLDESKVRLDESRVSLDESKVNSTTAEVTSTSLAVAQDGDSSDRDSYDVIKMTSLSHADIGGYSVDRILNSCRRRNDVTLGGVDVDDDVNNPRCLMDDDDDDDEDDDDVSDDAEDDDTHSSGVIDVVHVDLHE